MYPLFSFLDPPLTSTLIELHWPSVKGRVLIRKLTFLAKLLERDDVFSSRVFRTLASTNVYEISLIQQCHVLEQQIGTGFLQLCLQNPTNASSIVHEAKSEILAKDWNCTFQDSKFHHLLAIVSATDVIASSWNRIWDEALEFGVRGTTLTYTGSLRSSSQTNIWRQSLSSLQ